MASRSSQQAEIDLLLPAKTAPEIPARCSLVWATQVQATHGSSALSDDYMAPVTGAETPIEQIATVGDKDR